VVLSDILTPDSLIGVGFCEPNDWRPVYLLSPSAVVPHFSLVVCEVSVDFRHDPTYDGAFSLRQARFAELRGPNR
jgi:hypothetical protein